MGKKKERLTGQKFSIHRNDLVTEATTIYSKRNHTKRLFAKMYYSPKNKVSISLRLVQKGGTLLTQKIFDAQNFNAGLLTPRLLSLDGI